MIKRNLSGIDRTIRIVAGAGLLALVFVGPEAPWGYLGLVPLLSGVIGFCSAYCPLGFGTCRVPRK